MFVAEFSSFVTSHALADWTIEQISDYFGVPGTSAWRSCRRVCVVIVKVLLPRFVVWPRSGAAIDSVAAGFFEKAGMPRVLGAIDVTHIPIHPSYEFKYYYMDRKGIASISCQAVVDARRRFLSVDIGWPGSVHDARVFVMSDLGRSMDSAASAARTIPLNHYLVADKGYPLTPFMLTPYDDAVERSEMREEDAAISLYNAKHRVTRVVVECAFGILKKKLTALGGRRYGPHWTSIMTSAAVTLHNLHIEVKQAENPTSSDSEEDSGSLGSSDGEQEMGASVQPSYGTAAMRMGGEAMRVRVAQELV